jgi:hypothetical protein
LEKNIEEFPAARKEIESMDKRTHVGIARLEKDLPPSVVSPTLLYISLFCP